MDFDQLLQNCESEIETHLLNALYPALGPDAQREIEAQHIIDYYDLPATLPDFAFPNARIAIYCDGYEYHSDRDSFLKDRQQLRGLQLQGWCVLRFSGSEILNDTDAVVFTIQTAIRRKSEENRQITRSGYGCGRETPGCGPPLGDSLLEVWWRRWC